MPKSKFNSISFENKIQISFKCSCLFRLTSKNLNLELQLIRANERIEYLEYKLEEKSHNLEVAKKDIARYQRKMDEIDKPAIHSTALNVSTQFIIRIFLGISLCCLILN